MGRHAPHATYFQSIMSPAAQKREKKKKVMRKIESYLALIVLKVDFEFSLFRSQSSFSLPILCRHTSKMPTSPKYDYCVCKCRSRVRNGSPPQTVFLLAGWPDTGDVFRGNIADRLTDRFDVVLLTLPGYVPAATGQTLPLFGWSLDELAIALEKTIAEITSVHDLNAKQKPIMVAHDWGCVVLSEFLLRWPKFFTKLVYLDLAPQLAGSAAHRWSLAALLFGTWAGVPLVCALQMLVYQLTLVVAFFLPAALGTPLTKLVAKYSALGEAPHYVRQSLKYGGEKKAGKGDPFAGVQPSMNYLYPRVMVLIFTRVGILSSRLWREPSAPTFFAYGKLKPITYHTDEWLAHLSQRTDGSFAKGYEGRHWFFTENQRPGTTHRVKEVPTESTQEYFLRDLERFLHAV